MHSESQPSPPLPHTPVKASRAPSRTQHMKAQTPLKSTRGKQRKLKDDLLGMKPARGLNCPAALPGLLPARSPTSLHFNVQEAREPLPLLTRGPGYNGKAAREEGCVLA
ncbi:unnamed protein product [Pipistrellus nathusii]|uniref:Uncharacterized protein n=1 Tax=Pipistrellus nathusii TaxID=59473 RepID=A0ABP0AMC1_PIPNA